VFLLGGLSVDEKPVAMFIHSGDIVIMSGVSRLCYHGIPRILSMDKTPWNVVDSRAECMERICCDYPVMGDTEDYRNARRLRKETNPTFFPSYFSSEIINSCAENYFWEPFGNYLRTSRINMNVRQVLQPAMKSLPQQL
jgi:alkylated DNA repair protein alkB family protein 1